MIISILFLFSTSALAALIQWYRNTVRRLSDIPGPPVPSILVGNILELERARMGTIMVQWTKAYGRAYKIRGPLYEPWLMLSDPRGVNHVLQGKNYVRADSDRKVLELFFGKGLFCAEGEEHKRMTKSLGAAFTLQSVQEVSHVFYDLVENLKIQYGELLDKTDDGIIDIAPNIHMLALDAISMTMFMHNISASEGRIPSLLHEITNSPTANYFAILIEGLASIFPSLWLLPNPLKTYTNNLRSEFRKIAEEVWAGKEGAGMHAKVLDALAKEKYTDGSNINKEEAIAQIIGILFAGSETTANVVTECLYELARHRDIQTRVREELQDFQAQTGRFPNYEDLMSGTALPYFENVIRETLRTKAVLREIGRMAVEDDVIPLHFPIPTTGKKEVHVKAGEIIQLAIRDGVNFDESIWGPDTADFRPERWSEDGNLPPPVKLIRAQGHLYTFGDGYKVCLGRLFAIAELKIVVASLISSFEFEDTGNQLDFYRLGGNTVKPMIRGREKEGVQMPLRVKLL